MGLSKLWAKDSDGSRGFVFSHVKTIYYNWAQKKLLSTKLDEIDALIDQKIAKAMMSNVQVNDQNKVPTSALAYAMQQQITENEEAITGLNSELEQKLFGNLFPWFPNGESLDNMIQISSSGYFPNAGIYIYGTKEGNCPAEGLPLNVNQYGTLVIFAGNGDGGYGYGFALYVTTHEDNPFLSVYTRRSGWGG